MIEFICYDSHSTSVGVEPIDLILQAWGRAEILHIAIDGVGEVDFFVFRVDGHIVQGIELTAEVIVKND
jgi:hypothetical protein